GRSAAEGVCRRGLRLLLAHARRPAGAAPALAPLRPRDRRAAWRGAGQGVRRRGVRAAGQGRHAADGAGHQERDAPGHRRRAVDERRDEEGGDGQTRSGGRSHRLPRHVARIRLDSRHARRGAGQPAAGGTVRPAARPEEDRPAGGSRRVEHDAADRQRLPQPEPHQHQLPGRHPAAAVLSRRTRRGGELRRRRRRHRSRADARLRRSRAQVRRRRQRARLVDRDRCEIVRGARVVRRRSVFRLHRGARHEDQRPPHAGREHGRQRRPASRADGLPRRPRRPGEGEDRRLHAGAAALSRLGAAVVRVVASGGGTPEGANQPAFVQPVSRQRSGVEHARVPEGVLVQGECADGAAAGVPRVVRRGQVGRVGQVGQVGRDHVEGVRKMKQMSRRIAAFIVVTIVLALPFAVAHIRLRAQAQSAAPASPAPPAQSSSGLQLDAIDRSVDACTDFYKFACGNWMAKNPVPADRSSWGRFDELQERNNETLKKILEGAPGADAGSRKIGDYYASCMDESAINAKGAAPLDPLLKKVAALTSANALAPLVAELHTIGVKPFFNFGTEADFKDASVEMAIADQGGMGLPDRDYYSRDDAKSVELRKQYVEHVGKMASLLGDPADRAAKSAEAVMKIETALAKAALDVVARRDPNQIYHKLSAAELQKLTPQFQWQQYFTGIGSPPIYALNVTEPDFFKAMGQTIADTPLDDLKAYLRWHIVHASAVILSAPFVNENFRFYGTQLTGAKELRPRWKRCVQYTDSDLGEALGQAFVKEAF